jgi:hypothetical protein
MSEAQTPDEAAAPLLSLALDPLVDPHRYGELIQFGEVIAWR